MKWLEVKNKKTLIGLFRKVSGIEMDESRIARTVRGMQDGELKRLDDLVSKLKHTLKEEEIIDKIYKELSNSSK